MTEAKKTEKGHHFCSGCADVRTAAELGVVTARTPPDELFCGRRPPQVDACSFEPYSLPQHFNAGQGYRDLACWTPQGEQPLPLYLSPSELHALLEVLNAARGEAAAELAAIVGVQVDLVDRVRASHPEEDPDAER